MRGTQRAGEGDAFSARRGRRSWLAAAVIILGLTLVAASSVVAAPAATASGAQRWPAYARGGLPQGPPQPCGQTRSRDLPCGLQPPSSGAARATSHRASAPLVVSGVGQISGHVTAAVGGKPLEGVEVCAEAFGPVEIGNSRGCEETAADGSYTIKDLAPGRFTVEFDERGFVHNLERQYYNGRAKLSEADPVVVQSEKTTAGIDAAMQPGAQISGEVGFALGVGPLPEFIEVCAIPVDERARDNRCGFVEEKGSKYTIDSLDSGAYIIVFVPDGVFAPQYYAGVFSFGEASYVTATAGATTQHIDATLTAGGTIKGLARDATTGVPVEDAFICPEGVNGDRGAYDQCRESNKNGEYEIQGVMPGEVRLSASDPRPGYSGQFYSDRFEYFEADPLQVVAGGTLTAEFHLGPGGSITGQVTSAFTKTPLPGVEVCAEEPESLDFRSCEETDANGRYVLQGLPAGSYELEFHPDGESEYVSQYYHAKVVPAQAERVVVVPGAEVHADAALELGGSVSGTVTSTAGGAPIEGAIACAWFTTAEETARCGESDSSGRYVITSLPPGQYKIGFDGFFGHLNIAPQFFSGRGSYAEAEVVTVTANHSTLNVNAAVGQGGEIKGTVVDSETGRPVWGYLACAFYPDGEEAGCGETDDTGSYTITGLPGGSYLVRFEPFEFFPAGSISRFGDQFYPHAPGEGSAVPVAVPAGGVASAINAQLKAAAVPVGSERPEAIGTPAVGATLGERHDQWLNGALSFVYQWERCVPGGSCEAIPGATARHYTVVAADAGHRLRVSETAINSHGPSQPEHSPRSAIVPALPPAGGGGSEPPPTGGNTGASGGVNPGQGGTLTTKSNLPSTTQIVAALLASLTPTGKQARIAALRKRGAYTLTFLAPSAGQLVIGWYELPKGAQLSKAKPIVLATGSATSAKGGKVTVTVKLNGKGKALLKHGGKVKLTAKGTFTPAGGKAVSATKTFALH